MKIGAEIGTEIGSGAGRCLPGADRQKATRAEIGPTGAETGPDLGSDESSRRKQTLPECGQSFLAAPLG